MNLMQITEILGFLADANPRFLLREHTPEAYLDILQDLDFDLVFKAAKQFASETNQFTPLPTPGILRDKAFDLEMLAAGIPTAAEAYGMVLDGIKHLGPRFCTDGAALRDAVKPVEGGYEGWGAYTRHMQDCKVCNTEPMRVLEYNHPLVAAVVRQLGGRDNIITDNPMADRARFIEAYNEIYARERMKHAMIPEVREKVSSIAAQLEAGVDPVHLIEGQVGGLLGKFDARGRADWQKRKDLA